MIEYIEYIEDILDFSNDIREECSICFKEKKLKNFCDKHKFCKSCILKWTKDNYFCPICRAVCKNQDLMKYKFEFRKNVYDHEVTSRQINRYFNNWHSKKCIKSKHKFKISKEKKINKTFFVLHCLDCNVDQELN